MSNSSNIKETYEAETKYGPFYTGGNIQWSPEGDHLFCQNGPSISVLSLENGSVISTLGSASTPDEDTINTFTLSPTSDTVITHHKSGLFKLFTWREPTPKKVWKSIHKGPVPHIALSPEDQLMVSGGSDSSVRLWNLHHHSCTHNLKGLQGVVSVLKFHPDSTKNLILASGDDTKIYCWDTTSGALKKILSGHFSRITSLSFHKDSIHMVSSGRDKVLILWDLEKGLSLRTLPVYESLEGVFIIPSTSNFSKQKTPKREDEILVGSGGEKGIIKIWEMRSGREVYTQENPLVQASKEEGGLAITHILFNKTLNSFAVVSADHNIIIHSLGDFSCQKQFVGYTDEILDIVHVGQAGSHLAVATNSCDIKLYDISTMSCQLLRGHTDLVLSLCVTPANRNLMISSAKDNSVRVWLMSPETFTMKCIATGTRHTASVGSVALSQASTKFFVSVSQDQCLKLWHLPEKLTLDDPEKNTLNAAHTVLAHQKDINCAVVSPNDRLIATGSQDKTAKLWGSESLQVLGTLRGHRRGVWCVRFSPIDQVLLTTSADCTMKMWSLSELNCLKTFEGHESSVLRAEFISRGMQLVTSGADGLLKLWSVKTSECTGTFEEHDNRVWALAVSQDESRLISGGSDSVMIVWKDVTEEKRQKAIAEREEMILEEQKLANLLKGEQLVDALKLALRLEKPYKVLKIVEDILRKGEQGLADAIGQLKTKQKEELLRCAVGWNTNSKNCQAAQLVINALLNDPESSNLQTSELSSSLEALIPYTDRHFKRVTRLLQDLHFLNYTVNYIKPHNTSEFHE
ncbi:transducin beta-like protein 3 [Fopius arisanus]|uniref:Transducin beta-like protein 3 n=1 Tax=Fopius arisanus TaxID=64838 RepID=A0A9R1TGF3_9HYME|nr:PREDICTED: transducin beta-like protein 3 [Fopius arisanus]